MTSDKRALLSVIENYYHYFLQPKHMLWVLKIRFFDHPKHLFKQLGKEIITILRWTYECLSFFVIFACLRFFNSIFRVSIPVVLTDGEEWFQLYCLV